MTVGTGFGEDGKKSLAKGLTHSIIENSPQKIIFFVSDESRETVDLILKEYEKEENEVLDEDRYELKELDDKDDFNSCYDNMNEVISKYEDYKRVLDYTSGTKTMSVSIATIAIINKLSLSLTMVKRGENGTVIANTEEIKSVNPYKIYDKEHYQTAKKYFNLYRFKSAQHSLSLITQIDIDKKELMNNLFEIYDQWDKFNHPSPDIDSENPLIEDISKQLHKNLKALSIINKKNHKQRCYYMLSDLINNAQRRYEEGKYEDAIARLYRSLELIAQIRLQKEYGQHTKDIDVEKLKNYKLDKKYIQSIDERRTNGKILLGVKEDYRLLNELNDPLGLKFYEKENTYLHILSERNNSILAHGLHPTDKENYEKFEKLVLDIAEELTVQIDNFIDETKFPKFEE